MKQQLKSWLSVTAKFILSIKIQGAFCFLYFIVFTGKAQIVNYVNNGSFEECGNCSTWVGIGPLLAKHWDSIDTTKTKLSYLLLSELPPSQQVPQSGYAWQWPKTGHNYIITSLYLNPNTPQSKRIYARNILKQNLQAGKTYCIKFYYSITNQSTHGSDGLGAYFGDNTLDTIKQTDKPLPYLIPQVQNPAGNLLTDTLNWNLITGTFTANGSEKYLVLGNFKTDAATNTVLINPDNLPGIATEVLYDDVSCIDIDLPADAGYDYYLVPGDSAFIGRTPDVGINEACTWYQLPNMATPIATIAGMYVKPAITNTYVVRQEICGVVKWDTVVVYQSAVGIRGSSFDSAQDDLKIYPQPAVDELHLQWASEVFEKQFKEVELLNNIGQLCLQMSLKYEDKQTVLPIKALPHGIYTLRLKGLSSVLTKKILIAR